MDGGVGAVQASVMLLTGILIGQKVRVPFLICLILFLLCLGGAVLFFQKGRKYKLDQPPKKISRLLFCAALFLLGMGRSSIAPRERPAGSVENFTGRDKVCFTGYIIAPPVVTPSRTSLRIQVGEDQQTADQPDSGRLLLVFYHKIDQEFQYGERLKISGTVVLPPDTVSGFSYRTWLERDGITAMMNNPAVEKLPGFSGSRLRAGIYRLRAVLTDRVYRLFPKPESALMAGILLGDETKITSSLEHDFQKTGTSHIIAISGANFTVLTWLLLDILRRTVHRWWAPLLMLPFIPFYTILVGGNAAVVRAAVMCGLAIFGSVWGRTGNGINNLAISAMVMGFARPLILLDLGFQLSVTATLGILLFSGPLCNAARGLIAKIFPKISEETLTAVVNLLNDLCIMSVSAQIFTVWVSAQAFRKISLISLPANFLIAPFQALIMIGGFTALLLSFLFYPLGAAAAWLVYPAPSLTIRIVQLFARTEWGSVYFDLPPLQAWLIIALIISLYLGRAAIVNSIRKRNYRPYAVMLLAFVSVMIWVNVINRLDRRTVVRFSQTKSAQTMEIRSPAGRKFVIADGITDYAAQELLEKQILPVRIVPSAAWIDISESWMEREFLASGAGRELSVLYLNGRSRQNNTPVPADLETGFVFSADDISVHLASSYMNKRAWIIESGSHNVLFPDGIPPKRIFTGRGARPDEVSMIVLGKRDEAAVWKEYLQGAETPVLLDRSDDGKITLVLRDDSIGCY